MAQRHRDVLGAKSAPLLACAAALAACVASGSAHAGPDDLVVLRTQTRSDASLRGEPENLETLTLERHVDVLIHEAAQDLGLVIDLSRRSELDRDFSDEGLVGLAPESWLVSPRIVKRRATLSLEIRMLAPGSRVLLERIEKIAPDELEMRVAVMMRDLVETGRGRSSARVQEISPVAAGEVTDRARSPGRAVLAFNAALFGAYIGYSLQQASGSSDERLTYPLAALGAGIGLGSSILVADEWDIGLGDAWFLAAGMWWPASTGWLVSDSLGVAAEDRYAYSVVSAVAGLSLAGTAASFGHISQGGAALTHSGGAFGMLLGGLTELAIEGTTDRTPRRGMGIGAGAGVVLAGGLALQLKPSSSRVLLVDLGASLGALTGAAAASPLLLVDEQGGHPTRTRLWLASIMAGTLAGAAIGTWATARAPAPSATTLRPSIGLVHVTDQGPVFGAGLGGLW